MWLVSLAVASLMALPNVIHVVGDSYQQLSRIRETTLSLPPRTVPRPPTEIILLTSEQAEADVVGSGGGDVEVAPSDSSTARTRGTGASESPERVRRPVRQTSPKRPQPSAVPGESEQPEAAARPGRERVMNSGMRIAPK